MHSICVFGDSTTRGEWDLEKGGWVNRLQIYVHSKNTNRDKVYNLGISAGTTSTILERFEFEAKIRKADALIFQSGGNDSVVLESKNGPNNIPIDQFRKNLEEIIQKAKNITSNIIFIGFKNVDETKVTPAPWGDYYFNIEIKKYNEVMKNVCQENNIPYLDIFGLLENEDFTDGLHPNAAGHEKIFEKVKNFLEKEKWI